jgi:hypothetical protein
MIIGELVGGCRDGLEVRMDSPPKLFGLLVGDDGVLAWYVASHFRDDNVLVFKPAPADAEFVR